MRAKVNGTTARKLVMDIIRSNTWGMVVNTRYCPPLRNKHIQALLKRGLIVVVREHHGGRANRTYVRAADGIHTEQPACCAGCGTLTRHYNGGYHKADCPVKRLL